MVALSGSGWRLAPSLVALIAETDRLFPNRDRSSDGSIGDLAHSTRDSDHNPSNGWVHAVDIDEDIAPGVTLAGFADAVVARRDPRVRYLIYEGSIVKSYIDSGGRPAWAWQPYTGTNAHTKHLHVSINHSDQARGDTSPWWASTPEDDMTPAELVTLFESDPRLDTALKRKINEALTFGVNLPAGTDRIGGVITGTLEAVRAVHSRLLGDDVDEAEVARLVLAGIGDVALSTEQVAALVDALPKAVVDEMARRLGG